jgi:hypothetical protein
MSKEQILQKAFALYSNEYGVHAILGQCIRSVCTQLSTNEHKILSKFDGNVAIEYFHQHYRDDLEQQLDSEGM